MLGCYSRTVGGEWGRFPSDRLGWAIDFRAGTCIFTTCNVSAARCDHDHHVPHPQGPTAGWNLDPECRHQHRGKTHAGFRTSRAGPTVTVVTPTGQHYTRTDEPLPIDDWAPDPIGTEDIWSPPGYEPVPDPELMSWYDHLEQPECSELAGQRFTYAPAAD